MGGYAAVHEPTIDGALVDTWAPELGVAAGARFGGAMVWAPEMGPVGSQSGCFEVSAAMGVISCGG